MQMSLSDKVIVLGLKNLLACMQVGHRNVASLAGTDQLALPDQPPVTSHVAHIAFSGADPPRPMSYESRCPCTLCMIMPPAFVTTHVGFLGPLLRVCSSSRSPGAEGLRVWLPDQATARSWPPWMCTPARG